MWVDWRQRRRRRKFIFKLLFQKSLKMCKFPLTIHTKHGFSFKCLFHFVHFAKHAVVFVLPAYRGSVILIGVIVCMFQLLNERLLDLFEFQYLSL